VKSELKPENAGWNLNDKLEFSAIAMIIQQALSLAPNWNLPLNSWTASSEASDL